MTAPRRTAPHLLCLPLYLTASQAWAAPCGNWDAGYAVGQTSGHESEALHHTWTALTSCDTFTFNHYMSCHNDDTRPFSSPSVPSTPTDSGVICYRLSNYLSATSSDEYVYRSYRKYAAKIFACSSSVGCSDYYGDGTHGAPGATVTNNADGSTVTDPERWLVKHATGYDSAANAGWVISADVLASAAMFYPDGFTDVGKLGLWYTVLDGDLNSVVMYQETDSTGWTDGSDDMVTRAYTTAIPVAQESAGGDFYKAGNPWVVPAVNDDDDNYVRMYLQVGEYTEDYNIRSLGSFDENGTDFGLECSDSLGCDVDTGGTCAYNDLCDYNGVPTVEEICPDKTSAGCFYFNHAGHGRIGWDSTDHGPVDFSTDTPFMLFTGRGDIDYCDGGPDDVYEATWNIGSGLWHVYTHTASGHGCPNIQFQDGHDPYILPLPNGGYKAYYNEAPGDGSAAVVCYSNDANPGSWEDCVQIVMGFDDANPWDGMPTDPHSCVGDTEMFAYQDGGTRHEGGFTLTQNGMDCFATGNRLLFIEHMN